MSNKDVKDMIKAAFAEEMPDALGNIKQVCESELEKSHTERIAPPPCAKRRRSGSIAYPCIAAAVLLVFSLGILFGSFIGINSGSHDKFGDTAGIGGSGEQTPGSSDGDGSGAEPPVGSGGDGTGTEIPDGSTDGDGAGTEVPIVELASLFIDVNPSIELQVNTEGRIVACIAGNSDAESMLGDMRLAGLDMKTALYAIIGAMYMNGFLTGEENSMLVSMKSESEKFDTLLSDVVKDVNDIMASSDISCSIVAQDVSNDTGSEKLAKENNISVGKMSLINKIIEAADDYGDGDISELSKLSIKDLNLLFAYVKESVDKNTEDNSETPDVNGDHAKDEILSDIFGTEELAASIAIAHLEEQLSLTISKTELTALSVRLSRLETGSRFEIKLAYTVTFIYDGTLYIYKVDTDTEHAELLASQPINPFDPIIGGIDANGHENGQDPGEKAPPDAEDHGSHR